jgi:hypothetical protein
MSEILCPYCSGKTEKGVAIVKNSWASFFFVGASLQHLWFVKDKRQEIVLECKRDYLSHRCLDCGSIAVRALPGEKA